MSTYHVAVERREMPAEEINRWMILSYDVQWPHEATIQATRDAKLMRLGKTTIWAALTYVPSFEDLQSLRDEYDAIFDRKREAKTKRATIQQAKFTDLSRWAYGDSVFRHPTTGAAHSQELAA